jgi:hypothetical protein
MATATDRLVQRMSSLLPNKPYALELAKDNRWEECLVIELPYRGDMTQRLANYLAKGKFEAVAIEAHFKDSNGLTNIFGIKYKRRLRVSELEFLEVFADAARNYIDFPHLISTLDLKVYGKSEFLLSGDPDIITVGIVNHWFSTGPVQIWKKGASKRLTAPQLERLFKARPEIAETRLNFQGISIIYDSNGAVSRHYLKPSCGKYQRGKYRLDKRLILALLKEFLGFRIV